MLRMQIFLALIKKDLLLIKEQKDHPPNTIVSLGSTERIENICVILVFNGSDPVR
jgi:hypothetical protein